MLFCKLLCEYISYLINCVISIEAYEEKKFESEIYFKLKDAEFEAKSTDKRYSHDEVFSDLRSVLSSKINKKNV